MTADTTLLDDEVKAALEQIRNDILTEMGIRAAPTLPPRAATPSPPDETVTETSPPEEEPATQEEPTIEQPTPIEIE